MKSVISQQLQLHRQGRRSPRLTHPFAVLSGLMVALLCASPFVSVAANWWPSTAGDQVSSASPLDKEPNEGSKYEPGTLIVKLKPSAAEPVVGQISQGARVADELPLPASLQALNQKYRVGQINPVFNPALAAPAALERLLPRADANARRANTAEPMPRLDHIFKLTLDAQADIAQAAQDYSADSNVEYAEPNWLAQTSLYPNDYFFTNNSLWGMLKVQAPQAWDKANGQGVIVAVVDSGVDINHPDLKANIWKNPGEIPGNGIDDDGNGLVDDVNGWDFAYKDNDPDDKLPHGTHVAGIIAAEGNNSAGVIGLAYKAKIMPLKAINDGNSGAETDLADAILYAVSHKAKVINNSWGGPGQSLTIANAVQLAHQAGVVVVSAAGNGYTDAMKVFPANLKRSLAVSAFDQNDVKANFSNFGHKLDVAAPGVGIVSTIPTASTISDILFDGFNYKYASFKGTSMAAPHVSALGALLIQAHPNWTNEEIRQAIRQSSDDTGKFGFDTDSGFGRINAAQAMALDNTAPPTALLTEPSNYQSLKTTVPIKGYANAPSGVFNHSVEIGAGEYPTTYTVLATGTTAQTGGLLYNLDTGLFPDGLYNLRIVTIDSYSGKRSEDHVVVTINNVFLASPIDHQLFANGIYQLTGQIAGNSCSYKLEWAVGCNATKYFHFITSGTNFGNDVNLIGLWNTATVPDGEITLRLTATCGSIVSVDQICVVVDKLLAPGWPVKIDQAPSVKSPKVADLDGDGKNEIILGASVFNADGTLKTGWTNAPGAGRTNPAILNLDGNANTLEVVAAVYDDDPSKPYPDTPIVYAYRYDKSVLWSFPVTNPDAGCGGKNKSIPSSISAADVDGDGQMEIVFTAFFTDCAAKFHTRVFILDAKTGALEQKFAVDGLTRSSVALADIDRNGQVDLVLATKTFDWNTGQSGGLLTVLNFKGNPFAGWPQTINNSSDSYGWQDIDPVVGDVDGDCHYEILVGKYLWRDSGKTFSGWPANQWSISTGVLAPLPDGDPQYEVITGGLNSWVYMVYDHTGGSFKLDRHYTYENRPADYESFQSNTQVGSLLTSFFPVQGNPLVADVDGDGKVEIIRSAHYGHSSPNIGLPIYGSQAMTGKNVAGFPRYVTTNNSQGWSDPIFSTAAVADVDKDNKTDLVVAAGGKLYLWNLGKTFSPSANFWPMFQRDLLNTGTTAIPKYVLCNPWPVDDHNSN